MSGYANGYVHVHCINNNNYIVMWGGSTVNDSRLRLICLACEQILKECLSPTILF